MCNTKEIKGGNFWLNTQVLDCLKKHYNNKQASIAFPIVTKLYKQSCLSFVRVIKRKWSSIPSAEAEEMKSTEKDLLQK